MTEIILSCPYCGDKAGSHHKHLHANEEKGLYFCQLCERGGLLVKLIKDYPEIRDSLVLEGRYHPRKQREPGELIKLSRIQGILRRRVEKYLQNRGLSERDIFDVWWDRRYSNRAIFVCREQREIVFWTGRSLKNVHPKWRFPTKGETKITRREVVYGLERFEGSPGREIWITEGVFDAIAVGGLAILGKYCSDVQIKKILSLLPKKLVVALDRDAEDKAEKLAEKLNHIVPTEILFPPDQFKDWGEMLEKGLI